VLGLQTTRDQRSIPSPRGERGVLTGVSWFADRITSAPLRASTPRHALGQWRWTVPAVKQDRQVLLRKEVIQPHLPVRLPCYDFVPIASPTFDGSLPYGLGHRLRVLPTFVT
jgi:hypothetical protein